MLDTDRPALLRARMETHMKARRIEMKKKEKLGITSPPYTTKESVLGAIFVAVIILAFLAAVKLIIS